MHSGLVPERSVLLGRFVDRPGLTAVRPAFGAQPDGFFQVRASGFRLAVFDEIFTEASVKMVADNRAMKGKFTKMIVAEIIYNGQRHEVWFSRQEIYELSYWTPTPFKALAGAIKKRLLNQ